MKKINIGLVGYGNAAQFHMRAWRQVDQVEVVAVCGRAAERAAALARGPNRRPAKDLMR